jgi:hypothetical protein
LALLDTGFSERVNKQIAMFLMRLWFYFFYNNKDSWFLWFKNWNGV